MSLIYNGTEVKKLIYNGTEIKEGYYNGTKVYSSETVYGWYKYNAAAVYGLTEMDNQYIEFKKTASYLTSNYCGITTYNQYSSAAIISQYTIISNTVIKINAVTPCTSSSITDYPAGTLFAGQNSYQDSNKYYYFTLVSINGEDLDHMYRVKSVTGTSTKGEMVISTVVPTITGYEQGSTNYGLVTSTNRSAYPDAGTPDNTYWYVYAGIIS